MTEVSPVNYMENRISPPSSVTFFAFFETAMGGQCAGIGLASLPPSPVLLL